VPELTTQHQYRRAATAARMAPARPRTSSGRWRACQLGLAAALLASSVAACGQSARSAPARSAASDNGPTDPSVAVDAAYLSQFHAKVLVDGAGYSFYIFGPDHRRAVTCTGACALSWPPLAVATGDRPRTGPGVVPAMTGVVPGPGGSSVVTYDGWPLYTYVADINPGTASGEGIDLNGGPWYLMRPNGSPVVPAGQPPLDGAGSSLGAAP
jgi:predicted lipoprotein with Yx(FWY)xxD motif